MTDLKIFAEDIEEEAVNQINLISSLDAFNGSKIRIMPDVHAGKGCVCGFTANLGKKVVPNLIGVDIGCGMLTVKLGDIDIDFQKLDNIVRNEIRWGLNVHDRISDFTRQGYINFNCDPANCVAQFSKSELDYFMKSIASGGSGNHFAELDENIFTHERYLVIHTGSRNLGKKVCEYWQQRAIQMLRKPIPDLKQMVKSAKIVWDRNGRKTDLNADISHIKEIYNQIVLDAMPKNPDLAYLEGVEAENYIHDMKLCQRWAELNRKMIAFLICRKMGWLVNGHLPTEHFQTVHNYLGDDGIIRKSAISAYKGEKVLIPLNMRDGAVIAEGKGNADWNFSAPHGAGRRMSRTKAMNTLDMEGFRESMKGIWTSSVNEGTIDEAPAAYKDSESILRQISDTVEIKERLRSIYNFKASNEPRK